MRERDIGRESHRTNLIGKRGNGHCFINPNLMNQCRENRDGGGKDKNKREGAER